MLNAWKYLVKEVKLGMSFLLAKDLQKKFYTEGSFYHIMLNEKSYTCRGLAKISRIGIEEDTVDAVFVMVNPGSCQPTDEEYQFPDFINNLHEIPMIPAKSDPTQYQIMRLMERKNWGLVYIVNLSDLRAGNINVFREYLNEFQKQENDMHSIFSPERIEELFRMISKDTVVITAWGTQPFMKERMKEALTSLSERTKIMGIPHTSSPYYYHPNPMIKEKCMKWLDDMSETLKDYQNDCS